MSVTTLDFPDLAIIPYKIYSNKNIEPNAKLHFGCLLELSKKEGFYCATNKQFADMHGVTIRQIRRWHKSLEENGFIKMTRKNCSENINLIQVFFDGNGGDL